ncbi:MAG TPA: phosphatase PAP2 family protein [Rhodocyclaceae bacterium]|nr:phosphatase PAP2 family protein [Rhodocyclaceae bacterium]
MITPAAWYFRMVQRICILAPVKALGTMAFMALFFWGYFSVLHHPLSTPVVMPLLRLDELIPFTPAAYPVYVSLWVYVSLPPALFGNLRALLLFCAWIAAMCTFCLGIFWCFPTLVPIAPIDWNAYPQMVTIKNLDAAGNAFPSLHVASAVFSGLWLDRLFRHIGVPVILRFLNVLECALILWSTIAIRQHVVLDVVGGTIVGVVFACVSLRFVSRRTHL